MGYYNGPQADTLHDDGADREYTYPDGTLLTLECSGIAVTVTLQRPGEPRWRAQSRTYWPETGGPVGLPEYQPRHSHVRVASPYVRANDMFQTMRDYWTPEEVAA